MTFGGAASFRRDGAGGVTARTTTRPMETWIAGAAPDGDAAGAGAGNAGGCGASIGDGAEVTGGEVRGCTPGASGRSGASVPDSSKAKSSGRAGRIGEGVSSDRACRWGSREEGDSLRKGAGVGSEREGPRSGNSGRAGDESDPSEGDAGVRPRSETISCAAFSGNGSERTSKAGGAAGAGLSRKRGGRVREGGGVTGSTPDGASGAEGVEPARDGEPGRFEDASTGIGDDASGPACGGEGATAASECVGVGGSCGGVTDASRTGADAAKGSGVRASAGGSKRARVLGRTAPAGSSVRAAICVRKSLIVPSC